MNYETALQSAILSQEVYQSFASNRFSAWQNTQPTFVEQATTDTQLAILAEPAAPLAVIAFRGSDAEQDWNTNTQLGQQEYDWTVRQAYRAQVKDVVTDTVMEEKALVYPDAYGEPSRPVKMHSGFISAYLSVRAQIHDYVHTSPATQYRTTGHSLGGALAALCAIDLQYNFGQRITVESYTFGSPRVGNAAFAESYNRRVPHTWRVVHGWDLVVGLPRPWQGYRHVDQAVKLDRGFTWRIITGSFDDHRIDRYIGALKDQLGRR
ncbi:lipase family protein [Romeria aff. gracilis LEGE 07310]|uniref:Lipase family protein n=1 Tax=Vasconcelosia minhoensis LEGE 07310 TaxID=915328 RepID=A0A8J7DMR3_9CYAN|nr:lipase family protein [Romeria gracilis]MBE9079221.1 lipase family protein [Romeria aff. gracilis LEGE 07310]